MSFAVRAALGVAALASAALLVTTFERPPVVALQAGYRGLAVEQVINPRSLPALVANNTMPEALPRVPAIGPTARQTYQNVQVLGDLTVTQFARAMAAITQWVAPPLPNGEANCGYCHNTNNFASEEVYTKVVARRMLQMTLAINTEWSSHVAQTGVTCYTCHRGQPVPANVWVDDTIPARAGGMSSGTWGQNLARPAVGLTSLPYDPFTPFLSGDASIRVQGTHPHGHPAQIGTKVTEHTYGLMMHMSTALGVNCTFCHNSRAFASWEESPVQRTTAWHGIRMVREINNAYITPLAPLWAANPAGPPGGPNTARVGPHGDPLKVFCATCHQGANRPLLGQSMLADYPEFAGRR